MYSFLEKFMTSTFKIIAEGYGRWSLTRDSSWRTQRSRSICEGQTAAYGFRYTQLALIILAWLGMAEMANAGAGEMAAIHVMQPMVDEPQAAAQIQPAGVKPEPWVKRSGRVTLNADQLLPRSQVSENREVAPASFLSSAMMLDLFPDRSFDVIVDADSRPRPGVLNISAHLYGADLSTFSLTVTPDSYIMTLQDMNNATLYRVVGNTGTGEGRVTEIDLTKLPPRLDSEPLMPPGQ